MPFPMINFQDLLNRRNAYSYPAVALEGRLGEFAIKYFTSTFEQDEYQNRLLNEESGIARVFGYLSVLFWGHYSGADARTREERAFGKVRLAYDGKDRTVKGVNGRMRGVTDIGDEVVAAHISRAIQAIADDQYDEAIIQLNNLPGLQLPFSSKVCAFIDPEKCGVIDRVVAVRHPAIGFARGTNGYVTSSVPNITLYREYCRWLQERAQELNNIGDDFRWTDRDGSRHRWRALDVERALY